MIGGPVAVDSEVRPLHIMTVTGIKSCMLIESPSDESAEQFIAAVEDLLRDVHIVRGSADWAGISAGFRFAWRGTHFREFVCIAGSVIAQLIVRAGRGGGISRAIILRSVGMCREIHDGVETEFDSHEIHAA